MLTHCDSLCWSVPGAMPTSKTPELSHEEIQAIAASAHSFVDLNFSAVEHLPDVLQKLLRPLEVTTCQHSFPVLTMMLTAMAGLSNGATVQLWNTAPTPVSALALYVGEAQQGKSRLTSAISAIIAAADDSIAAVVQERLTDMTPAQGMEAEKPETLAWSQAG